MDCPWFTVCSDVLGLGEVTVELVHKIELPNTVRPAVTVFCSDQFTFPRSIVSPV